MTDEPYGARDFLKLLARQIVAEIQPAREIKEFTNNTAIVGQYVEASIRRFVRKNLAPIRVSTGGVIDQNQTRRGPIPQLDTIAWIPGPVAAVFEVEDFGLVPRSSCLGILEVKSSAYAVDELEKRTSRAFVDPITASLEAPESAIPRLRDRLRDRRGFGLGVISLLQEDQRGNSQLQELRRQERVAVIYEEDGDRFVEQGEDIYHLVNFLDLLRLRASMRQGLLGINLAAMTATYAQLDVASTTTESTADQLRTESASARRHRRSAR